MYGRNSLFDKDSIRIVKIKTKNDVRDSFCELTISDDENQNKILQQQESYDLILPDSLNSKQIFDIDNSDDQLPCKSDSNLILVTDDCPLNIESLTMIVSQLGKEADFATNGLQVLNYVKTRLIKGSTFI